MRLLAISGANETQGTNHAGPDTLEQTRREEAKAVSCSALRYQLPRLQGKLLIALKIEREVKPRKKKQRKHKKEN